MKRSMGAGTMRSMAGGRGAGGAPLTAILALALAAAGALFAAEFATVASVSLDGESCEVLYDASPELADRCALSGFERHGGALILLALVAAGAGFAARTGATTTGGGVLAVVAVVALGLTLLGDLPVTNETGAIGLDFEGATAQPGLGFFLELVGGLLAAAAAALALLGARGTPASAAAAAPPRGGAARGSGR